MSKYLFYTGNTGFPFGHAQVERQKLIAKGLTQMDCSVTVLNTFGVHRQGSHSETFANDHYEGIRFIYSSGTPYRPPSFLQRNLLKAKGTLNAVRVLYLHKRKKQLDVILITCNSVFTVMFYGITGWFLRVPVVIDVVEYRGATKIPKSLFKKIDHYLYDRWYHLFVTKIICISDFLLDVARGNKIKRPLLKIPSIVDYSLFDSINAERSSPPFYLYCGSTHYFEIILFIIESFEKLGDNSRRLCLVLHGDSQRIEKVKDIISQGNRPDAITVMSSLSYEKLVTLYKSAYALLIPLRNTFQDIARFPHKVGEYCAAGRPIISTNIGEVGRFFKDMDTALLAEHYNESEFEAKMRVLSNDSQLADAMGNKSYLLGKNNFDYVYLGKQVYRFIFDQR